MPFAPHAERADVDEGHVRIAVVMPGQSGEKMVQLLQKDGIEVVRLPQADHPGGTLAELEVDSLGAGILHPFRRGVAPPAFAATHADGDLLPLGGPALRGRIEQRPVELSLLRLQERPGHAEIDRREAGPVVERVGGLQLRTVVLDQIGVEMERPAHAGIHQGLAVILRLDSDLPDCVGGVRFRNYGG